MAMQPGTSLPIGGLSYVKGSDTPPLSELTVPALLANTAALHGSRPAVVFREQNIHWTWNEFSAEVDRMAAGLHALGLRKATAAVKNTRGGISKASMKLNDATPEIEVNPETYEVRANGELLTCEPAEVLPMAQRYFLF